MRKLILAFTLLLSAVGASAQHLGDFCLEDTIHILFTTTDAGAPTTLAGSPVVDVYEDGGTTEITAGDTLTADFDAVTGLNHLSIAATDANGYEVGKFYNAVIDTGTVGGNSVVGYVVGRFSIEATSDLRATTCGNDLDVAAGGEAGIDLDNNNGDLNAADFNADLDDYVASMTVVATSTTTEFALAWYDNNLIATAATANTIWCLTADSSATDVIGTSGAPTSFTGEAGSSDHFYLSDTFDLVDGTIYACRVQATIDGSTRTWWFRVARTGHTVSSDLIAGGGSPLNPENPLGPLGPLARLLGGRYKQFYLKTIFAQERPFVIDPSIFKPSYPNDPAREYQQ